MTRRSVSVAIAVLVTLAALVIGQQVLVVPGDSRWAALLQNALHVPWFFCVALLVFRLLGARLLIAALLVIAAALLELLQYATGRQVELTDFIANVIGLTAAVAWQHRRFHAPALSVAVLYTILPFVLQAAVVAQFSSAGPVLFDATHWLSRQAVQASAGTRVSLDASSAGAQCLLSESAGGNWPGIHLDAATLNLADAEFLELQLEVRHAQPLRFFVGLRFACAKDTCRVYTRRNLAPGLHTIEFGFETDFDVSPDRLEHVSDLFIYFDGADTTNGRQDAQHSQAFCLHRVSLGLPDASVTLLK